MGTSTRFRASLCTISLLKIAKLALHTSGGVDTTVKVVYFLTSQQQETSQSVATSYTLKSLYDKRTLVLYGSILEMRFSFEML